MWNKLSDKILTGEEVNWKTFLSTNNIILWCTFSDKTLRWQTGTGVPVSALLKLIVYSNTFFSEVAGKAYMSLNLKWIFTCYQNL